MKILTPILLIISLQSISAQEPSDSLLVKKDIEFATYLIKTDQYEDAIFHIDRLKPGKYPHLQDTLNYMKGWAFYNLKQLDSSLVYLSKVDLHSFMGKKSHFFAAYNSTFLGDYSTPKVILQKLPNLDNQLSELSIFERAGIALLERNYAEYRELSKNFTYSWYSLTEEEKSLDKYYHKLASYRPKSIVLAGILSSIIPGSGKIYAGKVGEGVSALLYNAILAGLTLENYHKSGPGNFKTIFFGSLFTVFYIGNIYGSMVSVNVSNNEFYSYHEKQILFHLHIPLRTIFN